MAEESKNWRKKHYKYQPGAGLKTDLENLLGKFVDTHSVRYEEFAQIWKEQRMNLIYSGRQNESECREFAEECFRVISQYILPPYNFQVRVGALYLLYAVFSTQPCYLPGKIRVTQSMWQSILDFKQEAHRQQHLDVEYIFHLLRMRDAFLFVATSQPFSVVSKEAQEEEGALADEFVEEQNILSDVIFTEQSMDQISIVHKHYSQMKTSIDDENESQPSKSLSVIKNDFFSNVNKVLKNHFENIKQTSNVHATRKKKISMANNSTEEDEDCDSEQDVSSSPSKKSKLKAKAFKRPVQSGRRQRRKKSPNKKAAKRMVKEEESLEDMIDSPSDPCEGTALETVTDTTPLEQLKASPSSCDNAVLDMPLLVPMEPNGNHKGSSPKKKSAKCSQKQSLKKSKRSPQKSAQRQKKCTSKNREEISNETIDGLPDKDKEDTSVINTVTTDVDSSTPKKGPKTRATLNVTKVKTKKHKPNVKKPSN